MGAVGWQASVINTLWASEVGEGRAAGGTRGLNAGQRLTALMWDSLPTLACLEALVLGTFQAGLHAHHRARSLPGTQQWAGSHGGGGSRDRDLRV